MGADYIGFIGCELQAPLGIDGFLRMLKLRAYRAAVESQVPPEKRAAVQITVSVNGVERDLTYADIINTLGTFDAGCPSCAGCVVGQGKPVGCYRFVTYPVDAKFESLLFDFFVSDVDRAGSIGSQFFDDVVSKQGTETGWHRRGERALAQGQLQKRGGLFTRKKFDSAQLLATFFLPSAATQRLPPVQRFALLVAYSRLVREFVEFARKTTPPGISRTLDEVDALQAMVLGVVASSTNGGGTLYVDS
ncbi:MAG: hypothetical protein QM817_32675 [Archangium sp.]